MVLCGRRVFRLLFLQDRLSSFVDELCFSWLDVFWLRGLHGIAYIFFYSLSLLPWLLLEIKKAGHY